MGDCWFISALAVLASHESILKTCFWREDKYKDYGLYVLKFFKDCNLIYVIIDDRLPIRKSDGRLIYASSKDPNELWVPFIEKAYAKLHGSFSAIVGGYTHYALGDLTGYSPRQIVFKEGFVGSEGKWDEESVWKVLNQYKEWKSLIGCSIQPNPKDKNMVEAEVGNGLIYSHAYSLLDCNEINLDNGTKQRLVKIRNPWGRGEWQGAFSDESEEMTKYEAEINRVFNTDIVETEKFEVNSQDGVFFMKYEDFFTYFNALFIGINFPSSWSGQMTHGIWKPEKGGNRSLATWISNPRFKLKLPPAKENQDKYSKTFVGLYINDSRLILGKDYYKVIFIPVKILFL